MLNEDKKELLFRGTVIPAHPLALNADRKLDEEKQRRLTRYYMAAGAGGVAVAVHTTQFEIRDAEHSLLEPVLRLAAEEVDAANLDRPFLKIAGVVGKTEQALREARLARKYGYDLVLLGMAAFKTETEEEVLKHVAAVAAEMPVLGFYLQTSIGGRAFSYDFWKAFADIPNVWGIKVAAFNRYQTIDVVRAVCNSSRRNEIALYTGNDDNIVNDLLTEYRFDVNGEKVAKRFVGGLLGHWAAWTGKAVWLLEEIKKHIAAGYPDASAFFTRNIEVTDMNAAIFDPFNAFHGCIAGVHQVLYLQGLLDGIWCLNPDEDLSPGQAEEIERVRKAYPHLIDDSFVAEWLESRKALA
ncbi:MAG: dihydrodipicolinate synthase family protein [Cytophagaceae bacterium SCN 52-12]|nr:MAG: dihydrodipicolinate synthase family protein [Cytophagaceae bacterium SCN 52-12]